MRLFALLLLFSSPLLAKTVIEEKEKNGQKIFIIKSEPDEQLPPQANAKEKEDVSKSYSLEYEHALASGEQIDVYINSAFVLRIHEKELKQGQIDIQDYLAKGENTLALFCQKSGKILEPGKAIFRLDENIYPIEIQNERFGLQYRFIAE